MGEADPAPAGSASTFPVTVNLACDPVVYLGDETNLSVVVGVNPT